MPPSEYRVDRENAKFRIIGANADEIGVATLVHGQDSNDLNLPILVVNDGSGRGKIVVGTE